MGPEIHFTEFLQNGLVSLTKKDLSIVSPLRGRLFLMTN